MKLFSPATVSIFLLSMMNCPDPRVLLVMTIFWFNLRIAFSILSYLVVMINCAAPGTAAVLPR